MTLLVVLVVTLLRARLRAVAVNEPIDPRVRLAISQWPDDAPRGAVSTFCAEHGISRKSFYELRKRAKTDGPAAVLEPRSRRPRSSPSKLTDEVKAQAVRCVLRWRPPGWTTDRSACTTRCTRWAWPQVPSIASLARIFREAGVARLEPKKKPRSAWRRFVYPAPNACWQLDATEYVLTGGRTCVIFQLIDDHSRYAVASHVAWGETAEAAIAVFDKAVAAHGVPQRLLSDNGIALNPSRRGYLGQLVDTRVATGRRGDHRQALQADHPGQERTLPPDPVPLPRQAAAGRARWPSCRPRSTRSTTSTTPNVPTKGCPDASHRARPGRRPRRPTHRAPSPTRPFFATAATDTRPAPAPTDLPAGTTVRTLTSAGTFILAKVSYKVDGRRGFEQVLVVTDGDKITVADLDGEVLIEHTRPAPGVTYVGNGRPRGHDPKTPKPSPKS